MGITNLTSINYFIPHSQTLERPLNKNRVDLRLLTFSKRKLCHHIVADGGCLTYPLFTCYIVFANYDFSIGIQAVWIPSCPFSDLRLRVWAGRDANFAIDIYYAVINGIE